MKIIRNKFLPPRQYDAMNLFGILFCRPDTKLTEELIRHERIHTAQMLETGILPFYLWYGVEWLIRLVSKGSPYYRLSFEREAYEHMDEPDYLSHRRHYAWLIYLRRQRHHS